MSSGQIPPTSHTHPIGDQPSANDPTKNYSTMYTHFAQELKAIKGSLDSPEVNHTIMGIAEAASQFTSSTSESSYATAIMNELDQGCRVNSTTLHDLENFCTACATQFSKNPPSMDIVQQNTQAELSSITTFITEVPTPSWLHLPLAGVNALLSLYPNTPQTAPLRVLQEKFSDAISTSQKNITPTEASSLLEAAHAVQKSFPVE